MSPLVALRRLCAGVLIALLLTGTAAADQRVILVLGDSLSAAYNMATENGWVHLLNQRLADEAPDWRAHNASTSGETTRGGLSRLPRAMEEHEPELVIIALGGNDGLRGLPPAEIRRNLSGMVEAARERDARVLLAGVRIPSNYGAAYTDRFEQAFIDVAEETESHLLPGILAGIDDDQTMFMNDGIHPTEEAQPMILENVWEKLEPLLN